MSRLLHILRLGLRIGTVGIDERSHRAGFWYQLPQHFQPLCVQLDCEGASPGHVAAGPVEACARPSLWSEEAVKTIGMIEVAAFAAIAAAGPPLATITET